MDAGLEKIIAAETVLSDVDGEHGQLIVRGFQVEELAATRRFEDVVHLLWSGFFQDLPDTNDLIETLGRARVSAFEQMSAHIETISSHSDMEGLRAALALMEDGHDFNDAIEVLALASVATASISRRKSGQALLAPDPSLDHAADFLRMVTGKHPEPEHERGLNAYLVTVAEHGLNASTFAARVVASTKAGLLSSVIAGVSALKGPLHGGAPGPVLDMLDGIGTIDKAEAWIGQALDRGERLMGFGHRVYRVRDPRADALKKAARALPKSAGRLALAEQIETEILQRLSAAKPDRSLETNVEYYTAVLLEALGFRRESFTSVFACARIAGWIAHAQEQLATNRIVRPASRYVGPPAREAA